jgi:hypothetical protein
MSAICVAALPNMFPKILGFRAACTVLAVPCWTIALYRVSEKEQRCLHFSVAGEEMMYEVANCCAGFPIFVNSVGIAVIQLAVLHRLYVRHFFPAAKFRG